MSHAGIMPPELYRGYGLLPVHRQRDRGVAPAFREAFQNRIGSGQENTKGLRVNATAMT